MKTDIAPSGERKPYGRLLEGQNQAAISTVTKVRLHWNDTFGASDGYDLWMGRSWIAFTLPEWRLEQAINPPLASKVETQDVNWTVTWNRPNGRPSIIDLAIAKENEMNQAPDTTILDDALGRAKGSHPIDDKPAKRPTAASGAAPYIRNHVKKHCGVEGKALNEQLKVIFMGMEPEQYIRANGVDAAYRVMDAYDAGQKSNGKRADAEPQSDDATSTPSDANNGHSENASKGSTDMPQPSKTEPSTDVIVRSATNSGVVDLAEKKDEIRERYTLDMRGKDYLTVQGRVLLFRLEHADWTLDTDVIAVTELSAVFKATIKNADGRVIASGHGRATEAGTKNLGGRFIEKAETAAIGRALALAGYGTDDTLDDRDWLSDSPLERKTG